eukprot:1774058-Ditylum_brightwellii.AAC.1
MAAALMAIEDFNARNGRIVSELLDEEFTNCDVKFPLPWDTPRPNSTLVTKVKDDGDHQTNTARALLSVAIESPGELCAVAGSNDNLAAREASTIAAAVDVPYISHAAYTTKISRPPIYILSAKASADEYHRADALMRYLVSMGRTHVTLVYSNANDDILKVTSKAAKDHQVDLRVERYTPPFESKAPNSPWDAMRRVKDSGFRTVILAPRLSGDLEYLAQGAQDLGINTDDYL